MIEIADGFTRISAGSDLISPPLARGAPRTTGARITVDFSREAALAPGQIVRARYDFADNGQLRAVTGPALPTHTVVRSGRAVVFHYRISHWIDAATLMRFETPEQPSGTPIVRSVAPAAVATAAGHSHA
jgi:hypothetical protein